MADNRKDFRPRRLAFGGRFFPRACGLAAALAIAMASAAVQAEDAGLRNGAASLAAGKYDAAVRQLSSTINSDSAAPADAAMALYLRGIAYRKLGESARAIADLGAAIWLGLPAPDKIKAQVNRGLAYKSAGLSREGDAELAAARKAGGNVEALIAEGGGPPPNAAAIAAFSTEVRPEGQAASSESVAVRNEPAAPPTRTANASPGAWSTSVSDGQQPAESSSGNRLTRWFGSVTGSDSSAPAPPPEPAPAPQAATPPPPPKPARAPAIGGHGKLELVDHHRRARGARERRRKQEPLVAPVRPQQRCRASGATGRGPVSLWRRLPAAARHQPVGSRGEGAMEEGLGERRRCSAADRESRYRQFRHLLELAHRTLPGQGGKP